ncbi:phosphatidylinositol-specific phospholipase C domain-containing protein [Photorhabdus sp. SF281]|uniref:phosphatidylinositol-specific phospholipase C domain-containing protein n=1 Tax=Photorhabdus sp. SF281 TaxID=3459527 RepID=UPI0040449FB7
MSSREVHVTFYNSTQAILTLDSCSLAHGEWIDKPPSTIGPWETVHWRSDSDGIATGTEGKAVYTALSTKVELDWDNPYFGTDKNQIMINGQTWFNAPDYTFYGGYQTGEGEKEYITFTLCRAAPDWMGQFWKDNSKYNKTPLRNLMIPGTHDSGTSDISYGNVRSPDMAGALKWLDEFYPDLVARWAKTQNFDITQQLYAGIRYFDLRVAINNGPCICHSLFSTSVADVLDQVKNFIDKHQSEIIILDFNHFYELSANDHNDLANLIENILGSKLAPPSLGPDATPEGIWGRGAQIIVNYDYNGGDFSQNHPAFWCGSIQSNWPNTDDIDVLKDYLGKELSQKPANKFWVMQCILTIQSGDYLSTWWENLIDGHPYSVIEWEQTTNASMLPVIFSDTWKDGKVNIVMLDSFADSLGFVPAIIKRYWS